MERNGTQGTTLAITNNGARSGTKATNYVSASRLKLWLKCPLAYKLRYVDGIVTPTNSNLFLGQTVHRALEFYYRYHQHDVKLYPEYVGEFIKQTWPALVDEQCITFASKDDELQLQAQAINLVTTYLSQVPEDEPPPIAVEKRLEAPLIDPSTGENLGISLVGIIDLVLDDRKGAVITDFKTTARSSSQLDVIHELQMSCYSYLWRQATGQTESRLEIRSIIKTKTPKVSVEHYGPRQVVHFERLFSVIRAYLDAISNNRYYINPGIGCSFCDYRQAACQNLGEKLVTE